MFLTLDLWNLVPRDAAMLVGAAVAALIRCLAISRSWALPVYRPRPGRALDDKGGVDRDKDRT